MSASEPKPIRFLGASLALLCVACTVWKKPDVAFEGLSIHGLSPNGANLEVLLSVRNPNSYRLVVRHFTYRLSVEGTSVGGGETDADVAVDAKSSADVRLPLSLDWRELKRRGAELLFSGGLDYAIDGEITFSTPIGTFARSYSHSGRVSPFEH